MIREVLEGWYCDVHMDLKICKEHEYNCYKCEHHKEKEKEIKK